MSVVAQSAVMSSQPRSSFSWLEAATCLLVLLLLALVVIAQNQRDVGHGVIIRGINNCRNIVQALKLYSADENGRYPDSAVPEARESNSVFRQLIITEKADS